MYFFKKVDIFYQFDYLCVQIHWNSSWLNTDTASISMWLLFRRNIGKKWELGRVVHKKNLINIFIGFVRLVGFLPLFWPSGLLLYFLKYTFCKSPLSRKLCHTVYWYLYIFAWCWSLLDRSHCSTCRNVCSFYWLTVVVLGDLGDSSWSDRPTGMFNSFRSITSVECRCHSYNKRFDLLRNFTTALS